MKFFGTDWKKPVAITVVLMFGVCGTLAMAQSYDPDQGIPKPTKLEKRVNKLGRGLTNILFGWTEIPVTWDQKMKQGKPFTYLVVTAPLLGIVRGAMRTGVGVYETVTFMGTSEEVNYEAILEPDYIF